MVLPEGDLVPVLGRALQARGDCSWGSAGGRDRSVRERGVAPARRPVGRQVLGARRSGWSVPRPR
jgi:hypothetical protein